MADFRELTEEIVAVIKQNENREITGQILQDILLAIVEAVNGEKQDTLKEGDITAELLADGSVIAIKIADGAVGTDKLADGAVTLDILAEEVKEAFAVAFDVEGPLNFKEVGGDHVLYIDLSDYFTKDEINQALETLTLALANEKRLREAGDTALTEGLNTHVQNRSNPHGVTKAQVGLGNVDNTSDNDKPVSAAQQAAIDGEKERAEGAEGALNERLSEIEGLVPEQAGEDNELADKAFVNSSIQTNTATFRGTVEATDDSEEAAQAALATITTKDNNDYANVVVKDFPTAGIDKYERYTYNGTIWQFNYALNTTGFTAAQIAAINSGATAEAIAAMARKDRANTYTQTQTVSSNGGSVAVEGGTNTTPAVKVTEDNVETRYKAGKIQHGGNTINLPAAAGTLATTGDVVTALGQAKDYTDTEVAGGVATAKGYADERDEIYLDLAKQYTNNLVGSINDALDIINGEEI